MSDTVNNKFECNVTEMFEFKTEGKFWFDDFFFLLKENYIFGQVIEFFTHENYYTESCTLARFCDFKNVAY